MSSLSAIRGLRETYQIPVAISILCLAREVDLRDRIVSWVVSHFSRFQVRYMVWCCCILLV